MAFSLPSAGPSGLAVRSLSFIFLREFTSDWSVKTFLQSSDLTCDWAAVNKALGTSESHVARRQTSLNLLNQEQ